MAGNGIYIGGEKIGGGVTQYNINRNTYKKQNNTSYALREYQGNKTGIPTYRGEYLAVPIDTTVYISDDINGTNLTEVTNFDVNNVTIDDPYWMYSFYNSSTQEFNIYCIRIADYPSNFSISIFQDSGGICKFVIKVSVSGTLPNVGTQAGLLEHLGLVGFLKYNNKYMSFNRGSSDIFYKTFNIGTLGSGSLGYADVNVLGINYTKGNLVTSEIEQTVDSGDDIQSNTLSFSESNTSTIACSFAYTNTFVSSGITINDNGTDISLNPISYSYIEDGSSGIGTVTMEVIDYA